MNRPIAFATPTRDPAAAPRAELRRAAADWRAVQAAVLPARARLVASILEARAAGLSHRQIAKTTGIPTMTVHDLEKEGRR